MNPVRTVALEFQPASGDDARKQLRDGLSAVLQTGNSLWVANDESALLDRLTLTGPSSAGGHVQFALDDLLDLPLGADGDPPQVPEVDIEGLDEDGGYLWLAGSHSRKRGKPDDDQDVEAGVKALARLSVDANRYLLARIPLAPSGDGPTPVRKYRDGGHTLHAATLRGMGKEGGNELTKLLRKDRHLGRFLDIPGKENGLDVEGLAVAGERIFLGLRGPVLRGWAAILELRVKDEGKRRLRLARIDGKGPRLRKHFLDLGGRGIRDLHRDGQDLLILAGPTMDLDGTATVFRWRGALAVDGPSLVRAGELEPLFDLPNGIDCDRAEGVAKFVAAGAGGDERPGLLVVYDAAAPARQRGRNQVLVDLFDLPQP